MHQLLNDFYGKMVIKNFSESTKKSYQGELSKYLRYCNENSVEINSESFQNYLVSLISVKKLSECSLKQSIGAGKFFLNTASISPMN